MCLLVAAALRPVIERTGELSEHTIFVVDASGSMTASEGDPDRLALAVERAKELRGDVPDGGTASVIAAGADTETLLTQAPDVGAFERALESIRATDGSADMAEAATEASALVGDGASVVLLSDGGLTPAEARQFPPGTRWETVGEGDTTARYIR